MSHMPTPRTPAKMFETRSQAWDEAGLLPQVSPGAVRRARWEALAMYDRRDVNGTEQRAFAGNFLYLLIVGIVGGGIFLAMGLAISGASKSEETAAPIANLVSLPLMFLSGIFFSRSNMPEWLQTITQYSPLTYVSDALRSISVDGASLWAIRTDLLGIFIWLGVAVVLATRLFKWEVV